MTFDVALSANKLRLGQVRVLFGMTSRALRYYEERGLVAAQRDRANARWYDAAARRRLEWIAQLRRDVPLDDIAEIIRADEAQRGRGHALALQRLERRRVALEDELARIQSLVAQIAAEAPSAGVSSAAGLDLSQAPKARVARRGSRALCIACS